MYSLKGAETGEEVKIITVCINKENQQHGVTIPKAETKKIRTKQESTEYEAKKKRCRKKSPPPSQKFKISKKTQFERIY